MCGINIISDELSTLESFCIWVQIWLEYLGYPVFKGFQAYEELGMRIGSVLLFFSVLSSAFIWIQIRRIFEFSWIELKPSPQDCLLFQLTMFIEKQMSLRTFLLILWNTTQKESHPSKKIIYSLCTKIARILMKICITSQLAIARTKFGPNKYGGAEGYLTIYNPKAVGHQYSMSRIRLQAGSDSIEAGWMVAPSINGNSRTYFFIRTKAGQNHCFNLGCGYNISGEGGHEASFEPVSKPGGPIVEIRVNIIRDNSNGNWNLRVGTSDAFAGYWPKSIFTELTGMADRVEWGGEVYSPSGTPLPPMGSSNYPIGDIMFDGVTRAMKVINENGQVVEADVETYADDPKLYNVQDLGYPDPVWGHVVAYGGPRHP